MTMGDPAVPLRISREYGETIDVEWLKVADNIRPDTYDRRITDEERSAYSEKVVELSLKVDQKEEEKKATVKMFGDDIKAAKEQRKFALKILKSGTVEEVDQIHTFLDHDHYKVWEYNSKGELIGTRRMRPEERQMNAF